MCKHILINDFKNSDLDLISEFAEKTYDKDGFGAIFRLKNDTLYTFKSLSLSEFYIATTRFCLENEVKTLVVHHRTSTNKDGLEYAHPFEFDGNILTHNGVVSVPGKHKTKTENDSEALLHHLIKTDFDTKSIDGYFSCFILNDLETIVLVDNKAPLFSDGRVYSSHKLSKHFKPIELQKLILCKDTGKVLSEKPIEVSESKYGLDKSHLSLGYSIYDSTTDSSYFETGCDSPPIEDSYLEILLDCMSYRDETFILESMNEREALDRINDLCEQLGITIDENQGAEVLKVMGF